MENILGYKKKFLLFSSSENNLEILAILLFPLGYCSIPASISGGSMSTKLRIIYRLEAYRNLIKFN